MLRQNRYKNQDFIHSPKELEIRKDEIFISKKHDIVIALEPYQVKVFEDVCPFIMKIIEAIPALDNETQDYFETVSDDTDFPHSLEVIYFENNEVILDYWSDEENNQFSIVFSLENDTWVLKRWNAREVSLDWHKSRSK